MDDIPVVPMEDSEIDNGTNQATDFVTFLTESRTTNQLRERYADVKKAFDNGEIKEDYKEQLRMLANQLFVKLGKK